MYCITFDRLTIFFGYNKLKLNCKSKLHITSDTTYQIKIETEICRTINLISLFNMKDTNIQWVATLTQISPFYLPQHRAPVINTIV